MKQTRLHPFEQAVQLARQGQLGPAERAFSSLATNPALREQSLIMLAKIAAHQKNYKKQCDVLRTLTQEFPANVAYLSELAACYSNRQLFVEASATLEKQIAIAPNNPTAYFNLAVALRYSHRFPEALDAYDKALDLGIDGAEEVYLNKAVIYSDYIRDDEAALANLNLALSIRPKYLPALLNKGNLLEEQGKKALAAQCYQQILEIDPTYLDALARLAPLTDVETIEHPIFSQLQKAIAQPTISPETRANLAFARAGLLDKIQQYDLAFESYFLANETCKKDGRRYIPAKQETYTDKLLHTFSKDWFKKLPPVSEAQPIFICGMFRSGSTLVEQIVCSHPKVTAGGELELVKKLAHDHLIPEPKAFTSLTNEELAKMASAYLAEVNKRFPNAELVTDKRPDNFLYVGLIKSLFPKARIILTERDAMDNCLSVYFQHLAAAYPYARQLDHVGHFYKEYQRVSDHWRELFPDTIHTVCYDDLVHQQEAETRALLTFLGLEWDDRCMEFHKLENTVKTASYWQIRQPLYTKSSGRWQNYQRHIAPLAKMLEKP